MRPFGFALTLFFAAALMLAASPCIVADDAQDNVTLEGYVSSVIKGSTTYLKGAEIVAAGTDGTTYKAITNDGGMFILSCPPGVYEVTTKCGGFEKVVLNNVIAGNGPIEISMELRDTSVVWGLDVPHTLEIAGIVVVLITLAIGAVMIRVLRKSPDVTVIDDADDPMVELEDLDELEDEYEDEDYVYDEDVKES